MASSVMSTYTFWLYTVALLLMWAIVITTTTPVPAAANEAPHFAAFPSKLDKSMANRKPWGKNSPEEQRSERNCKALCAQCGLLGFYCGEQCLCEYRKPNNNKNKYKSNNSDTECLTAMQSNAREQKLPFEILIQGPSNNRFVRTAMQFEQDKARADAATAADSRNKRSTIMIYKPYKPRANRLLRPADAKKAAKRIARQRRSVGQLDWFSDFANTLVRPAPLRADVDHSGGKANKKRDTSRSSKQKRQKEQESSADKTQSWFTDSANLLLRPAPLRREAQHKVDTSSQQETEEENVSYDSGDSMGHALKNTIRNIQDSEFGENLRARLRDGADILGSGNFELFPKSLRDRFTDTLDSWRKMHSQSSDEPRLTAPTSVPRASQPFLIPWFRPVRFLQRIQHAIDN